MVAISRIVCYYCTGVLVYWCQVRGQEVMSLWFLGEVREFCRGLQQCFDRGEIKILQAGWDIVTFDPCGKIKGSRGVSKWLEMILQAWKPPRPV